METEPQSHGFRESIVLRLPHYGLNSCRYEMGGTGDLGTLDKIYCIRYVKLPPAQISLNVPFEVVVSIADDVGTGLPGVDPLERMSEAH